MLSLIMMRNHQISKEKAGFVTYSFLYSLVGHFVLTLKISIRYPHLWHSAEIGNILTGLSSQMTPEQYYVFLCASAQHRIITGENKFERK